MMSEIVSYKQAEDKVLALRGQNVILDSDVAELYGVETREINQAVKNNSAKFPEGYVFDLTNDELQSLRSKILILKNQGRGKHTKYLPSAFTEKGLYMLATILKSPKAAQTTIAIVETFAKLRELSRTIGEIY
jgi:phage regulator Rha-like protein